MDLDSQIVPAVIILVANLLSGNHGSKRWENITAIFGWISCISIVAYALMAFLVSENTFGSYLVQIGTFTLITALARDYERILRPIFPWNR